MVLYPPMCFGVPRHKVSLNVHCQGPPLSDSYVVFDHQTASVLFHGAHHYENVSLCAHPGWDSANPRRGCLVQSGPRYRDAGYHGRQLINAMRKTSETARMLLTEQEAAVCRFDVVNESIKLVALLIEAQF